MTVAGVIIEAAPGRGPALAERLAAMEGFALQERSGDRLAAVWTAADGKTLERWAETIVDSDPDVLGIFPTFVGELEED